MENTETLKKKINVAEEEKDNKTLEEIAAHPDLEVSKLAKLALGRLDDLYWDAENTPTYQAEKLGEEKINQITNDVDAEITAVKEKAEKDIENVAENKGETERIEAMYKRLSEEKEKFNEKIQPIKDKVFQWGGLDSLREIIKSRKDKIETAKLYNKFYSISGVTLALSAVLFEKFGMRADMLAEVLTTVGGIAGSLALSSGLAVGLKHLLSHENTWSEGMELARKEKETGGAIVKDLETLYDEANAVKDDDRISSSMPR